LPYSRETCSAERFHCVIQRCFPDFPVQSISYLAEGWDSTVWEVNGSHVFRFPKRPAIDSGLRKEIRLLPGLAPALSLPIPQFDFVWQGGPEFEGVFVGYPKLPGVQLLPERWAALLHSKGGTQCQRQLGEFLTRLHRFPLARAVALGIAEGNRESWREQYRAFYETVQRRILPLLDEPAQGNLSRAWREFLDAPANFQFQPALIHCDLSGEHILFDPERGCITGIIDWEDAAIGDPGFDFTGLLDYGPEFVQEVLAAYAGPRDGGMLTRARFYYAIGPCYEVLYGLECNLPRHTAAGLKSLHDMWSG